MYKDLPSQPAEKRREKTKTKKTKEVSAQN